MSPLLWLALARLTVAMACAQAPRGAQPAPARSQSAPVAEEQP